MSRDFQVEGQVVDLEARRIFPGRISVRNGRIAEVREDTYVQATTYLTPGFVDAHVHVESSMLAPSAFARAACVHGTVATVSDPHEIANVLGLDGVFWMIDDGRRVPFKFAFGAPSCVPATPFETAGAHFGPQEIEALLSEKEISYLAEVMNFPAVIARDPDIMSIVDVARRFNKRIDGHAPGVVGEALKQYASAGIETDHECILAEEGRQRLDLGMKVAIREGSAAKNFEALWPLIELYPDSCFFCSDDKHPDDLIVDHINRLVARAVAHGVDRIKALRVACVNPVRHYQLEVGLMRVGDPADFIELENLEDFSVRRTWINGELVAEAGESLLPRLEVRVQNRFETGPKAIEDLALRKAPGEPFPVIEAIDGQLITKRVDLVPKVEHGFVQCDPEQDLLKIAVVNRYQEAAPVVGLIRNFGLKQSAIAGSVVHDSHNIVAVGANDESLLAAINLVIESRGGLSYADANRQECFPLPIAGLMSDRSAEEAAESFSVLTRLAKEDGCTLTSPYMTLSFMALLVIPSLKIGDKGLFDVDRFALL